MEKGRTKTQHFWSNFNSPLTSEDSQSQKKTISAEKLQPLGYPDMSKSEKNTITFWNIWAIFARKQGGVTTQTGGTKV